MKGEGHKGEVNNAGASRGAAKPEARSEAEREESILGLALTLTLTLTLTAPLHVLHVLHVTQNEPRSGEESGFSVPRQNFGQNWAIWQRSLGN